MKEVKDRFKKINLEVKITKNLILKNPFMNSSGMFLYGPEVKNIIPLKSIGAIVVKGITLEPIHLKKTNRISIIKENYSYINAVGFENYGIDYFIKTVFPQLKVYKTPILINLLTENNDKILELINKINVLDYPIGLEINVSCTNVSKPPLGYDIISLSKTIKKIKHISKHPIIVKMPPSIENTQVIARVIEDSGADAISLINSIPSMAIDVQTRKSILWKKYGGLSGPAIHPIALKMVYDAYKVTNIPIIGIGGIYNTKTALSMFIAGASSIQIGTALSFKPYLLSSILKNTIKYCKKYGFKSISSLVGSFDHDC